MSLISSPLCILGGNSAEGTCKRNSDSGAESGTGSLDSGGGGCSSFDKYLHTYSCHPTMTTTVREEIDYHHHHHHHHKHDDGLASSSSSLSSSSTSTITLLLSSSSSKSELECLLGKNGLRHHIKPEEMSPHKKTTDKGEEKEKKKKKKG